MKYGEISKLKAHDLGLSSVDILVGKSSGNQLKFIHLSLSLSLSISKHLLWLNGKRSGVFFQTKSWCSFKRGHLALKFTETII